MAYQVEQRSGFTLYLEERDRVEGEQACEALERTLRFNRLRWGLPAPLHLHMVIMTGWWSYMMETAPPGSKVSLLLLYPLWAGRVKHTWKFAGGWQNRFGRRRVVGIKPPRLIAAADRSLGKRVYVEVDDLTEKMRHMVYHEVTHACAAHLRLPAWFNEGLAMLSVDGLAGYPTVQAGTLETLDRGQAVSKGSRVRSLDPDTLVALYVRGYWITRYFYETQPAVLCGLLERSLGRVEIEARLAQAAGLPRERFWGEIEGRVKGYFREYPPR